MRAFVLVLFLFACDPLGGVRDECQAAREEVVEECERIVDEQIAVLLEWIFFTMKTIGCVSDDMAPGGWDCSGACE